MIEIKDHSNLSGKPLAIFTPADSEELISFLNSNKDVKYRIGAGLTGVSGAAVPENDEYYIDFSQYKSLYWIDRSEGIFSAAAGNTMSEIKEFTEAEGWSFPVMPGSLQKATLGGMIACNGGGPLSLSFGKIKNFIRSLEIITSEGTVLNLGSRCKKISEGPDFMQLFIGSEGSLGFISKAILSCVKAPEIVLYRISHISFATLLEAIPVFLAYEPLLLEMAEPDALKFSSGADESVIWLGLRKGTAFDSKNHPFFKILIQTPENIKERFDIGYNLQHYKKFIDLDISFPLLHSASLLTELKSLLNAQNIESSFFGHAGDGNWHIHVFYDEGKQVSEAIISEFDSILMKYEGHISGEHGIGRIHKKRFAKFKDVHYQSIYHAIKSNLDPNNKLPSLF